MSYTTREKKRRWKIAITNARAQQRKQHPDRHYLTIVSRSACCNNCGSSLRAGAECVYRYDPREILCKNCADGAGLHYRPSRRWERQNRKRKQGQLVPAARRV
jgi:hypothetical protein